MSGRTAVLLILVAALATTLVVYATRSERPVALPSATASATPTPTPTPSPSPSPAPTPSPPPTLTAAPSATPTPRPAPTPSCPPLRGGRDGANVQVTGLRAEHQPGFDRVVLEFGPSTAPGSYAMPPYTIAPATQFTATSGRTVSIDGNAFLAVRFGFGSGSTVDPRTGQQTFTQTDLRPALPLVREVRLVDDFERTMLWGIGLDRLVCPIVSELAGPVRLVVDLPTPP